MEFISAPILIAAEFGLNTDILETNLINQVILAAGLVFLGRNFLTNTLEERATRIQTSIEDSQKRLEIAMQRLTEAQKESEQIEIVIREIRAKANKERQRRVDSNLAQASIKGNIIMQKSSIELAEMDHKFFNELVEWTYTRALNKFIGSCVVNGGSFYQSETKMQDYYISQILKYIQIHKEVDMAYLAMNKSTIFQK
jgi:F-type H+-transporting ATPase subunit b|nr:ATP synthase CF0 subunit I [Meringosphaera mediterranea]